MTSVRLGGRDEVPALLAMFDEAVAWLADRGSQDQWGALPWSQDPARVDGVRGLLDAGDLWIAEVDGAVAGATVLGERPPEHVPAAGEPELYVRLLLTSRRLAGRGIGAALLEQARAQARRLGVALLRVDCWGGGDRKLVDYYVRAGFTPTETFEHRGWPGQVLEQRLV
ncbi:GNAT family N-acetyltransferase [Saccharopolyspora taberi]|uniref:GNAT family N-acetyltransferase n=1 Tax=Saccharopolyspora taberi TaxID=60895 RepID=A0ABN3VD46_9PSEU